MISSAAARRTRDVLEDALLCAREAMSERHPDLPRDDLAVVWSSQSDGSFSCVIAAPSARILIEADLGPVWELNMYVRENDSAMAYLPSLAPGPAAQMPSAQSAPIRAGKGVIA